MWKTERPSRDIFPQTIEVHVGRMILEQTMLAVSQVPKTKERMNILGFYLCLGYSFQREVVMVRSVHRSMGIGGGCPASGRSADKIER